MKWTKEARYRTYESMTLAEQKKLELSVSASPWRQHYHIQPMYGLLNDPNGFVWYNGRYYLFYQWFPFGAVHGMKHWFQTESADLVNWENKGVAIKPDYSFESHGIYSGSGIVHNNLLYLFYTANKRDEEWNRLASQCLVIMDKTGRMTKQATPIIKSQPEGYTEHFRDPKVWREKDNFYMVVGGQREDLTGCVLLYQSHDLKQWSWQGEVKTKERNFGFMWECPDYFELQNHGILLFSPQGIHSKGDSFQNIYQSGAFVGKPLNIANGHFDHCDFQEIDAGFDFYAPQTTVSPDGRRLLVGWMGLPDIEYPTDSEGWAHCLTLPRELSIEGNVLYQKPIRELKEKRKNEVSAKLELSDSVENLGTLSGNSFEMICEVEIGSAQRAGLKLRVGEGEETLLYLDHGVKKVVLDRTKTGTPFAQEYGTIRQKHYQKNKVRFQIFIDISSIEVFVNDGEIVFTSRLFPKIESQGIQFFAEKGSAKIEAIQWKYE
ncbi:MULTISPECIES: glycoside hydrolase family 32 protein [Metabacillus]|uniref:Sucrose-6-phosphate hydrolase n=2 Tax=Metabacillus TaxID=2675233 RepID=A0A179TA29_9BACI|nr:MULTISPECIES: sucrose-6-phosphate hydrolase [Metabacillus]OAS89283.1 sucrose-6-phosphate hydrolase [Metabacillus litoralis]QNF28797.1 sucrose-6-phosphate hydrolase [Metabacillus sp. KUDC1714]